MWKWKYDHITSTLPDDLHWLPIRQRIMYKLSTIVYKCIHGAAPSYLTNLCVPVATNKSRRYLRSATHGDLLVPRTRTVIYEPRSYAVSGPTGWNTLPSTLHVSITTLGQFHSGLKTILFRLAYGTWLGAFVTVYAIRLAPYKYSYLLIDTPIVHVWVCLWQFTKAYCGLFNEAGLPPKRQLTVFAVTPDAAIQPGWLSIAAWHKSC